MDNDLANDASGILSLSGFAYQIRVLIYYMSQMKEHDQIEFETLEDVVLNIKQSDDIIDDKSESFRSLFQDIDGYKAIQVKRTKINEATKEKLLFNWLLLEAKDINIKKYVLFTEEEYGNTGELFGTSYEVLYQTVLNSNKRSNALISKVKEQYKNNPESFQKAYERIKNNYEFISERNLNDQILSGFTLHFTKGGVSDITYTLRVKELIKDITGEIISAVDNKKSFICTFTQMMQKIAHICNCVQDNFYQPDYSLFKKARRINLSDQAILQSREYLQLLKCNLSEDRILEHLMFQQYYESIRYRLLEDNKLPHVENIESTTHENFCSVKEDLQIGANDTPIKRLHETKKMQNHYAPQNQTRYGSCIYLTKDDIEEKYRLSWEDEE